jgi:TolA-binding protein
MRLSLHRTFSGRRERFGSRVRQTESPNTMIFCQATTRSYTGRTVRGVLCACAAALLFTLGCASAPSRVKPSVSQERAAAVKRDSTTSVKTRPDSLAARVLSPASDLLIKACDNYLSLNPESPKTSDVLTIKASLFYNNKLFEQSRGAYLQLLDKFPNTPSAAEAIKMIAQGYYEEKLFDSAQVWYRKLSTLSGKGVNQGEAIERIAESIFRSAEQHESQNQFKEAAEQYQRISMEFPETKIADVSLFNAGLCYEKLTEWSRVILTLQQLVQKYPDSKIVPKAMFRIGIANAKLLKWDLAAESYLRMVASYPTSEFAPTALYNAGFAFENAGKLTEAAATFEKLIQLFPNAEDAADILFRAGELYGKLKNWEAVTRVNQLFSSRFGNDADRVVQALCMVGIALYMQNKEGDAIEQLKNAVTTFGRIKNPSTMNAYYAAKAQYTIGEIMHGRMQAIKLTLPKNTYKKQLSEKSDLLEEAVAAYSRVVKFSISEWTTRAICQIGQAYEDFGIGIFKQQRPPELSLDERIALELGIAQAVEKYFIEKALTFHEQNVKLGIKEKLEDKNILLSRQKLTYLPYVAGENYIALADITNKAESNRNLDGFALIGRKLELLQKIAPFQERATDLFLKCLEIGTTYQEANEFFKKASSSITKISFSVAETYADVVMIVLEAPIPNTFDKYERFVYKTKLLKQIEGYQEQAMTSYLKTLKIADAYAIEDESVKQARERLTRLLFTIGRCKDLLCVESFSHPPFPAGISEAEQEEYRARFEEIGLRFQEQAFDVYKSILKFAVQKYASGDFVTHAYVRMYQNFPEEYGSPKETIMDTVFRTAAGWKCMTDTAPGWLTPEFNDSTWRNAREAPPRRVQGFGALTPSPITLDGALPTAATAESAIYFRRTVALQEIPYAATLLLDVSGSPLVFLNGASTAPDSISSAAKIGTWNLSGKLRTGKNALAIKLMIKGTEPGVLNALLIIRIARQTFVAQVPGQDQPLSDASIQPDVYKFPIIKNFTLEGEVANK